MKGAKDKGVKAIERVRGYLRSPAALRLLICVIGTAVLTMLFEIAIVPVRYDLKVGMVPSNTIAATKDVVDELSTEKRRAEAAAAISPTYRFQDGVTESVLADFDQIFSQLRAVRQYAETLPDMSPTRVFSKDELAYAREMLTLVTLRDYQLTSLLRCTSEELEEAYTLLYTALQSTMQGHVTQGQEAAATASIRQIVSYRISLSLSQNIVPAVLAACIQPNMVIDQEKTEAARAAARDAVEPVTYKQGQNVVVRGEGRVTANQLAMLSTLGLLSDAQVDFPMYLGAALLVVMVAVSMLLLLRQPECHVFDDTPRLLLLFIVLVVCLGLSTLARRVNTYLAPIVLCSMLATALLGMRPGLICHVALTVLAAALTAGGSEAYSEKMAALMVTGLLSGTLAALILQKRATRLRVLVAGLACAAMDFLGMLALGLMTASELSGTMEGAAWRVGGTLIATLLCIGLQPLLESIFNLPTPMKLLELSNPNQPLLRRLLLEAPGTYHHSIIVANLAEAAAEAIGANPLLARVGGYYHDIGKLKRPIYFKENQMGEENAHDRTDPQVSAAILTAHTRDGVAMARRYRLPQAVINIIAEHHGNAPVMFFYHKALQMANGKPVDMDAFCYDGHPPTSKESAIVMLCDTIEAAVRSMKNPTPEGIEDFIVKLVRGKLEDGQLSDSPLTLRDIDGICAAATTVLVGVFHERIEYPDMDKEKARRPRHLVSKAAKQEQQAKPEETPEAAPAARQPEPSPEAEMQPIAPAAPTVEMIEPVELVEVEPPPVAGVVPVDELIQLEALPQKPAQPEPETPAQQEETTTEEADDERAD